MKIAGVMRAWRRRLAILLQQWARSLEAEETAGGAATAHRESSTGAPADGRSSRPAEPVGGLTSGPPEHWLRLVRQHAPEFLTADRLSQGSRAAEAAGCEQWGEPGTPDAKSASEMGSGGDQTGRISPSPSDRATDWPQGRRMMTPRPGSPNSAESALRRAAGPRTSSQGPMSQGPNKRVARERSSRDTATESEVSHRDDLQHSSAAQGAAVPPLRDLQAHAPRGPAHAPHALHAQGARPEPAVSPETEPEDGAMPPEPPRLGESGGSSASENVRFDSRDLPGAWWRPRPAAVAEPAARSSTAGSMPTTDRRPASRIGRPGRSEQRGAGEISLAVDASEAGEPSAVTASGNRRRETAQRTEMASGARPGLQARPEANHRPVPSPADPTLGGRGFRPVASARAASLGPAGLVPGVAEERPRTGMSADSRVRAGRWPRLAGQPWPGPFDADQPSDPWPSLPEASSLADDQTDDQWSAAAQRRLRHESRLAAEQRGEWWRS